MILQFVLVHSGEVGLRGCLAVICHDRTPHCLHAVSTQHTHACRRPHTLRGVRHYAYAFVGADGSCRTPITWILRSCACTYRLAARRTIPLWCRIVHWRYRATCVGRLPVRSVQPDLPPAAVNYGRTARLGGSDIAADSRYLRTVLRITGIR
jgi:hypothetical protein